MGRPRLIPGFAVLVPFDPDAADAPCRERFYADFASLGALTVRTRGECMIPVLKAGECVRVRARSFYLPGQVVAVNYYDRSIRLHRLIGFRRRHGQWQAITCGDRADAPDAPVDHKRIIGAVERVVSEPGRPLFSTRSLLLGALKALRAALVSFSGRWLRFQSAAS